MGSKLIKALLVLALVIYFLFLVIARTPASWGAWAIHQAAPGVRMTGISGTVWEGRATGGTAAFGGQLIPFENLRWQVDPWTLLTLKICAQVEVQVLEQPASGTLCRAPGNVTSATDSQLSAPMSLIGDRLNLQVGGLASLQLQELRLDGQRVADLQGNLSWRDARWSNGERWFTLGAFAAQLSANEQGGVHAEIFELDGPFDIQLTGDFLPGREPVIKGTVVPSADAPAPIRDALQFVGQPLDNGGFRVAWPPGT